ncbi:MAG: glycosyltransferase [Candidatus Amulumruptor caecigallinarius]|nr:glycosyltransferase [Candidatus Amulumruptor caecigallinarius]
MNILHYTIGLPPKRSGGSVRYAFDLMQEQAKSHNVIALICGDTLFRDKQTRISEKGNAGNVQVFSLSNPITPTLIYGVSNPEQQYREVNIDESSIKSFITEKHIDVMHLHTLQGIHKRVVEFIKNLGVKVVYTPHDFHGVCPHYDLIKFSGTLCKAAKGSDCAICNLKEPSDKFLRFANSHFYQFLKARGVKMKRFMKFIRSNSTDKPLYIDATEYEVKTEIFRKYDQLIEYYKDFFNIIDKYHFNSIQTKEIFTRFIPNAHGETVNVFTSGMKDRRRKIKPDSVIRLGFIGNTGYCKGFPMLKKVMIELMNEGICNIRILVYGSGARGTDKECGMIEYCPHYRYEELSDILYQLDGTLVPSILYETFSLVTLESLAHGRPAFVSNNVGAKDIVAGYNPGYVFSSETELKKILRKISTDRLYLSHYADRIMEMPWNFTIEKHAEDIIKFYKELH